MEIIAYTKEGAERLEDYADEIKRSIDIISQECGNFEKKMRCRENIDDFGENIIEENKKMINKLDELTEDMGQLAEKMKNKAYDIRCFVKKG